MFRQIIAPVDFSPLSELGLRWAGALARCGDARLTVVYANPLNPPAYFTAGRVEELQVRHREETREAGEQLRRFASAALGPAAFEARVAQALPVDAILAAAEETGADLIVMGTHGRSGFNRFMLGSVAERVLHQSTIPVLTVRGDAERAPDIRSILCPVNDSAAGRSALAVAARLAECAGAKVTALHVVEPGGPPPPEGAQVIRQGDAAAEIVAAAAELPCDLLVIGTNRKLFYDATVLGTTTARVVRHAPCPVLTVVETGSARTREAEV